MNFVYLEIFKVSPRYEEKPSYIKLFCTLFLKVFFCRTHKRLINNTVDKSVNGLYYTNVRVKPREQGG